MPRLQSNDDSMMQGKVGAFSFSGVRPQRLGAPEYTIVTVASDISGSTGGFEDSVQHAIREAIEACKHSPRAENLLLRYVNFNHEVHEKHGFMLLKDLDPSHYPKVTAGGGTALYDAVYSSLAAANSYAKNQLTANDYNCNAITFIITDGVDEHSTLTPASVRKELENCVKNEDLESHMLILVGINMSQYGPRLQKMAKDLNVTQVIDAGDADAKNLAKLANFISRSISSQSQSLGTGGPSQTLTF